jgi:hypothetical protein
MVGAQRRRRRRVRRMGWWAHWPRFPRGLRRRPRGAARASGRRRPPQRPRRVAAPPRPAPLGPRPRARRRPALPPAPPPPCAARRHPDKNAGNPEEATQRFQAVNAAYARLTGADESDDELGDVRALRGGGGGREAGRRDAVRAAVRRPPSAARTPVSGPAPSAPHRPAPSAT